MGHKYKVIVYSRDKKTREEVRKVIECDDSKSVEQLYKDPGTDKQTKRLVLKVKGDSIPMKDNDKIGVNPNNTVFVVNEVDRGMIHGGVISIDDVYKDKRKRYILAQVYDIAGDFYEKTGKPVQLVGKNLDYLIIRNYRLPGLCNYAKTPLVIHFPATYPEYPPIGYYIKAGVIKKHMPHIYDRSYYDAPDLSKKNLWWVCLHEKKRGFAWHHNPDNPRKKDNLWTFLTYASMGLSVKDIKYEDDTGPGSILG